MWSVLHVFLEPYFILFFLAIKSHLNISCRGHLTRGMFTARKPELGSSRVYFFGVSVFYFSDEPCPTFPLSLHLFESRKKKEKRKEMSPEQNT